MSHGRKIYCTFLNCSFHTTQFSTLWEHYKKVHTLSDFVTCPYCGNGFSSCQTLKNHVNRFHLDLSKKFCPYHRCFFTSNCSHVMDRHLRTHKEFYVCNKCQMKFANKLEYTSHCNKNHGEKKKCPICEFRTKKVDKMHHHIRVQHLHENSNNSKSASTNKTNDSASTSTTVPSSSTTDSSTPVQIAPIDFSCTTRQSGLSTPLTYSAIRFSNIVVRAGGAVMQVNRPLLIRQHRPIHSQAVRPVRPRYMLPFVPHHQNIHSYIQQYQQEPMNVQGAGLPLLLVHQQQQHRLPHEIPIAPVQQNDPAQPLINPLPPPQ